MVSEISDHSQLIGLAQAWKLIRWVPLLPQTEDIVVIWVRASDTDYERAFILSRVNHRHDKPNREANVPIAETEPPNLLKGATKI